ncbi:hypothetical protein ICM_01731 [Bacillus cereus BAG1X2-3]|uniref:Uncharacterized protein n=3 Tax=Bacillaceae TaxID=186817 RepID=A0A9X7AMZ9_BACTU|nr:MULTISPECIES: hypothetical protein [Bacillus]EOO27423.1 hypothetical protein ICC_03086 [Bacillus cereus BAG1X1-1]KIQ81003.1 hypothetical protein RT27_26025 [Bacillus sp. L_1B0_5]KIQ85519.1 hypothetical protein RW25_19160 [Bacillus sp. L_1B0_8]MBK0158642.1 hypothetical protein [Bacillus sp. S71]ALC52981.1 hypothetical protein ACN91_15780 [Bacillus cereus]
MMGLIIVSRYIEEQTRKELAGTMAYDEIEYELSKQYQRFTKDYEQYRLQNPCIKGILFFYMTKCLKT